MAQTDMVKRFQNRKRNKRPPSSANLVPGFGGYREARVTQNMQRQMGHHDGAPSPAGKGPFKRKRRRVPQSGSPDRYYANRPHRPRYN